MITFMALIPDTHTDINTVEPRLSDECEKAYIG